MLYIIIKPYLNVFISEVRCFILYSLWPFAVLRLFVKHSKQSVLCNRHPSVGVVTLGAFTRGMSVKRMIYYILYISEVSFRFFGTGTFRGFFRPCLL